MKCLEQAWPLCILDPRGDALTAHQGVLWMEEWGELALCIPGGGDSGRYGVLFCGLEILDFVFYLSGLPSGPPGILDNES